MRKVEFGKRVVALCWTIAALSASGCTTRMAYEAVRENARNECWERPTEQEQKECLARTQDSFDEYQRKREEVVNER